MTGNVNHVNFLKLAYKNFVKSHQVNLIFGWFYLESLCATRRRGGGGGRGTTAMNGRTDERTQHSTTHAIHVPLRWQQGESSLEYRRIL